MTEPRVDRDATPESVRRPAEPVHYPTNHVVAVVDTPEQLTAAVNALKRAGFPESEVVVGCGQDVADAVHASTGRSGLAGLAIRVAQRLGASTEETELKDRYEEALRDGKIVVSVLTPDGERKERAAEILGEHGARVVNFFGRFAIEGMHQ